MGGLAGLSLLVFKSSGLPSSVGGDGGLEETVGDDGELRRRCLARTGTLYEVYVIALAPYITITKHPTSTLHPHHRCIPSPMSDAR